MAVRLRVWLLAAAAAAAFTGNAYASSVTQSQGAANNLVSSAATPAAASATASIIAGGIANAINPGGGFAVPGVNTTSYFDTRSMSGVAAGGSKKKAGAWVQGGYTKIKDTDSGGEFDGNVSNVVAGLDFKPGSNRVIGLSFAYENMDITTTFNTGTFKGDGFTLAPYAGITFNNGVVLDGMVGISWLSYDTARTNSSITGSFDATRYMGSVNLSKAFRKSRFTITPKVGVLQIKEKQDSYTESNGSAVKDNTIDIGRLSFGGTAAFNGKVISPYFRAMGEYDYDKPAAANLGGGKFSSNDKFGINAAIGANVTVNDKVSLNVEATSAANLRDNLDIYGVTGRVRIEF